MSSLKKALVEAGLASVVTEKKPTVVQPKKVYYKYRGLPCSIEKDDKLWEVSGIDTKTGGYGVLEWCYDKDDAENIIRNMEMDTGRFEKLSASAFSERRKEGNIHPLIKEEQKIYSQLCDDDYYSTDYDIGGSDIENEEE